MLAGRPKLIGFYTEGPPFDGGSLAELALGGSETALIQAARALADRGHQVLVFNNCDRPGRFDGVAYLPRSELPPWCGATEFDVFIVSRFFGFFRAPVRAGLKVLWNHDTLDRPAALRPLVDRIDLFFVLSSFHRDNFLTRIPEIENRIFVTRNGIDLDLIAQPVQGTVKNPHKVIYASRPERGLQVLLERIWPRLLAARPDLTLYLCGYEVKPEFLAPGLSQYYERLQILISESKNVVTLGPLSKDNYYRHLAEAALMLYPCTFPEISCIAALEAQACRTPLVTTDDFALSETVQVPEFKVPGRPGFEAYDDEFIRRVLHLLDNPDKTASLARQAAGAVEKLHTWPKIVEEWERLFDLALLSKHPARKPDCTPVRSDGQAFLHPNLTSSFKAASAPNRSYPHLKKDSLNVLLLDTGYYLVREVTQAFLRLGHQVRRLTIPDPKWGRQETINRLLEEYHAFKPDFVFTVNHLGFDVKGVLTGLLADLRMPLASWFVDSPTLILGPSKNNVSDHVSIFLWDADYIQEVRAMGFNRVHYLPLGTDETVFKPLNGRPNRLAHLACPISFVGHSMIEPVKERAARIGLPRHVLNYIDQAAIEYIRTEERSPGPILTRLGLPDLPEITRLDPAEMTELEGLVIWRASQIHRLRLVRTLAPLRPTVIGDQGWTKVLEAKHFQVHPGLHYYDELPWFYPVSRINFNVTSLQMKKGLNQRVFDVPACAAFLLTDQREQLEKHFEVGREVVCYREPEEALELGRYFLEHDRERRQIAQRGHRRVLAEHTYRHRLQRLLRQMREDHLQ